VYVAREGYLSHGQNNFPPVSQSERQETVSTQIYRFSIMRGIAFTWRFVDIPQSL
jgi:hypothetical protein